MDKQKRFNQIPESQRTESLHPIGIIAMDAESLIKRYDLIFDVDEHYSSIAAMLALDTGEQYMLLRHLDDPAPGTEVLASDQSLEPERDLDKFLRALELDPALVTWRLSHIDCFKQLVQSKGWLSLLGTPLLKFVSITWQQMYQSFINLYSQKARI